MSSETDPFRLDGRVALVTGASRGIGLAIATAYAERGARVVLNARGAEALEQAAADLRERGLDVHAVAGHAAKADSAAHLVDAALERRPAVNGGVFAYQRGAEIVDRWRELAETGRSTFICDEIALQLILTQYPHKLLDCRYNCSPVYGLRQEESRIWHFHGERHVRDARCREIWLPAYRDCLGENVARLAEWSPGGDRRLAAWQRDGGAE